MSPPVPAAPLTDELLLARYRPWLYYDSLESYRSDSAASLPEHVFDGGTGWSYANSLKRKGGSVVASARPEPGQQQLDLGFLGGSKYRNGAAASSTDFLDAHGRDYVADARRMHGNGQYADRCYGHIVREANGTRWVQYWFFYYYNDKSFWGIGLHEGDWEMIQLRLDASDTPTIATYAHHSEGEGFRWADLHRRKVGSYEAPVVYVGRGSHASFAKPGQHQTMWPLPPDYADGKGEKKRPVLDDLECDELGAVAGQVGLERLQPAGTGSARPVARPGGLAPRGVERLGAEHAGTGESGAVASGAAGPDAQRAARRRPRGRRVQLPGPAVRRRRPSGRHHDLGRSQ